MALNRRAGSTPQADDSDLDRLLAAERRMADALDRARVEAEAIVQGAESEVRACVEEVVGEIDAQAAVAQHEFDKARARTLHNISATTSAEVERCTGASEAEVAQLASQIVHRLVARDRSGDP